MSGISQGTPSGKAEPGAPTPLAPPNGNAMLILNCIISSAFLPAAGNWLGVGFRAKHGRSLIDGAAAMAAGSYFLIAAIGAAV